MQEKPKQKDKNTTNCDHNGTGYSDSDDLMALHFEQELSEGSMLHFFVQCDDCGQKMRVKCTITSIKEEN